jgi:hypothetical protein
VVSFILCLFLPMYSSPSDSYAFSIFFHWSTKQYLYSDLIKIRSV